MDIWPSDHQRSKRSFDEMSQQATLSPSPIHTFFGLASFSRFTGSGPSNNTTSGPSDRRRFSHPHNPPQQFRRPSEDMVDRTQFQQLPRLQHQASQTLTIDLTDEPEDAPIIASRSRGRARSQRPPQLGRSDAQALENVIDLTDDSEIEITSSRQLPLPRPDVVRPPLHTHRRRLPSPPLFVSPPPPQRHINRVFPNDYAALNFRHGSAVMLQIGRDLGHFEQHFEQFNNAQVMPGQMDYQRGAFADRKPDHVPPLPAQEGFTRSPTENDIIICPSCEEELVHKKDAEEPTVKKGGKTPTRKEREEHPFWVVRECGHVYCNSCYQNRLSSGKSGSASFPEKTSGSGKSQKKVPFCAVEDCQSDVKNKDKWVGVFL